MDAGDFLKGYLILGGCTLTAIIGCVCLSTWWAGLLAILAVALVGACLQDFYTGIILAHWEGSGSEAYRIHKRIWRSMRGFGGYGYLYTDPRHPYPAKEQEMIDEWKAFNRVRLGACLLMIAVNVVMSSLGFYH